MLTLKKDIVGKLINDKVILITGGTGSFGNQLTRTLLDLEYDGYICKKIIILSRDEFKQHLMQKKFPMDKYPNLRYFLGDVRDSQRMDEAIRNVDIVFHAAALKRIDMLEYNPQEGIKTNIIGTQNVVNSALKNKVKRVFLISTDKATSPANLYGATKLCAERLVVSANALAGEGGTIFGVLRYGNVFASRGSVVPIFHEQKKKGVLTITDGNMTRFTLTLPEAISFVLNCSAMMIGGETFIPKLPSYNVLQLADLIAPEAKKEIIGLRPGEKMHESMISVDEGHQTKEAEDFFVITPLVSYHQSINYQKHYKKMGYTLKDCPRGFSYSSDQNNLISNQDLTTLLENH